MKEYIKPSIKKKPSNIIILCGINDLKSENSADDIARNIVKLAVDTVDTHYITVLILYLVGRNDQLNRKSVSSRTIISTLSDTQIKVSCT